MAVFANVYDTLPVEAKKIRIEVFMEEQGYQNEFDEMDSYAKHLVLFDKDSSCLSKNLSGTPIAVCRFFEGEVKGDYIIGRIAVTPSYRGKNVGAYLMKSAENEIRKIGGKRMVLHAQTRVQAFYEKQGFIAEGTIDYDENHPHIWMYKQI